MSLEDHFRKFYGNLENRVSEALGLKAFSAQVTHSIWNIERSEFDLAHAEYLWSFRIDEHWRAGRVTLAVGRFRIGRQQEIKQLAALLLGSDFETVGLVDVSHLDDPVKTALQHINLIETDRRVIAGGGDWPKFEVSVATPSGYSQIMFWQGDMRDESWIRLRDAAIEMVSQVKPLYHNRRELEAFFARGVHGWAGISKAIKEQGLDSLFS
jgi:hypothetical protein